MLGVRGITDSEYKDMKASYELKIASFIKRERELREANQQRVRQESTLSSAHKSVKRLGQVFDLTFEVINRLVKRINVYEDKSVGVKFTFSDEIIYNNRGADNE